MNECMYNFMGIKKVCTTKLDQTKEELMLSMIISVQKLFEIKLEDYNNLTELIVSKRRVTGEMTYFWDWLDEYGYEKIKEVLETSIIDNEELEEELEYRKFVLEMDSESAIPDNLFMSIADTIQVLYDYVQINSETSATLEIEVEQLVEDKLDESETYTLSYKENIEPEWRYIRNPADNQQDFNYNNLEI